MRTIILNTSDIDGGAARAAYRLHNQLHRIGLASTMLVQVKLSADPSVLGPSSELKKELDMLRSYLDAIPLKFYRKRSKTFWSTSWLPSKINFKLAALKPEIIHLHWICGGFIPIKLLPIFGRPLIWTIHDMWPFTGGCHYAYDCSRYRYTCGACPQLGTNLKKDLSYRILKKKEKYWKNLNLTVVSPSRWLAECARTSTLFRERRVEVIPNGLDLTLYKPVNKNMARNILGLDNNKKYILFGAVDSIRDSRKGFQYLKAALQQLATEKKTDVLELLVFGALEPVNPPDLGLKANYLGRFYDDMSLAIVYSAADIYIAPSIQENLSNTVMEALACGIPCVAFNIGGMPDLVEHKKTGYLGRPFEVDDLAKGIKWVLADSARWQILSQYAREKAEKEYNIENVVRQYIKLYEELV